MSDPARDWTGPDGPFINPPASYGPAGTGSEASGARGGHHDNTGNANSRGGHHGGGGWGTHGGSAKMKKKKKTGDVVAKETGHVVAKETDVVVTEKETEATVKTPEGGCPEPEERVGSGSYQWGFSLSVLLYFIILNGLWVVGTYGVWTHLFRKSRFVRHRPMGSYRAILDLAEIIHEVLGDDLCAYTDDELEAKLSKQSGVRYTVEDGEGGSPGHVGLTSEKEDGVRALLAYGKMYGRTDKEGCP